jgi:hypothetical protein
MIRQVIREILDCNSRQACSERSAAWWLEASRQSLLAWKDKCMLPVPTVITTANYQTYPVAVGKDIDLTFKFEGESVSICLQIQLYAVFFEDECDTD